MQDESGSRYKVVSSKDLGTNCWLPKRFVEGHRCDRVQICNYPEKVTCKAVGAEIEYLGKLVIETQEMALSRIASIGKTVIELMKQRK